MRAGGVIALWLAAGAGFASTACDPEGDAPTAKYPNVPSPSDAGAPPITSRAPIVAWPPVVMRCLQMGDSCGGSAATCRALTSLSDDAREEAMRCFDASACATYTECFRAFLIAHPLTVAPPPVGSDD